MSFNTIKVNNTDTNYTHSIFDISEYNSGAIYANLSAALAAIPESKLQGGMSIKFIQQVTLARYSVVKTENLETLPTGTLLSEAPYIDSGTYDESQLSTIFSTLPSDIGAGNALTYYVAVTVDETTTYTSWVITKVLNSYNKYVHARLMADSFTIDVNQWQVVDSIPKYKSKNLAESGSVYELKEILSLINYKDTAIQMPSVKSSVPKTDGTIVSGGNIIGRYDIPIDDANCVIDISTVVSNYAVYNGIAAWALYSGTPSSANLLATGTVLGQNNDISVIVTNYPTAKTLSIVADFANPTIQGFIKSLEANYITENDVINSLDSDLTNKPLSAAKGKELRADTSLINIQTTPVQLPATVKSNVPKTDGSTVTGGNIIGRYDIPIDDTNCVINATTTVNNYNSYPDIVAWALYSDTPSAANLLAIGNIVALNNNINVIVKDYPTAKILSIVADFSNPTIQVNKNVSDSLTEDDVVNSLDSNSTNKPLSAAQGKALNGSVYELKEKLSLMNYKDVAIQVSSVKSNVPKTDGTLVTGGQVIGRYDIPIADVNCVIDITTVVSNYSAYEGIAAWALYSGTPSPTNLLATGDALRQNNDISVIVKNYPTASILSIVADFSNPTIQGTIKTLDLNYITENDVVNSLDSNSTNKPLSAAQGKALNDKFTTSTYITGGDVKSQIPTSNGTLTSGAQVYGRKDYSLVGVSGVVYIESDADNVYSPEQWPTAVLFAIYDSSNHFIVAGDLLKDNIRQSSIDLSNYPNAALLRVTCSFSSGVVSVLTNEDKYASKEELDELQNEVDLIKDSVSVELPSEIIIVKGVRVELFTRAFVKCFNPYIYHIEPVCTIGKAYPRYILFKVQDEWVGNNYALTINVRNNDGKIIATGNTIIKVINKATSPVSMKNVLVFGSSLMAKGYVASELKRRLTETSGDTTPLNPKGDGLSNISFVGRKVGSRVDTIHQEGTGGWAWEDYAGQGRAAYRFYVENVESVNLGDVYSVNGVSLTVVEVNIVGANEIRCTYSNSTAIPASGTLTKVSGDGDATITYTSYDSESYNPFYYNGGLDFAHYADLYCNGHIDYLIGYTGTGLVGQSNAVQRTINNVKAIADAYHADFPNGKFLIVSQALPDPTGGMGADYGCSASNNYYYYAKVVWEVAAAFNELANDDNYKDFVVLVPNTQQFDCEYSYPSGMVPVNNRSSETVRLGQNGLHPIETAEYQVSDSIYNVMHKLLSL